MLFLEDVGCSTIDGPSLIFKIHPSLLHLLLTFRICSDDRRGSEVVASYSLQESKIFSTSRFYISLHGAELAAFLIVCVMNLHILLVIYILYISALVRFLNLHWLSLIAPFILAPFLILFHHLNE